MERGERLVLPAFLASALFGGGNAIAIKFSNAELDPVWGATLRFGLAAILMWGLLTIRREKLPRGRALVGAVLYGVLAFGAAFALGFYALVELDAGFATVLLSTVPLLTLLLAVAQRQEKMRREALIGSIVALGGIALMVGLSFEGSVPILPVLAMLGGAALISEATIIVRWFPGSSPVALNAVGMTAGSLVLITLTFLVGNRVALPAQAETWTALAYMVVVGTGVVFNLYLFVLEYWEASRAAYGFVLVPPVTIALSPWLLGETVNLGLLTGGALVVAGVYLGALRSKATTGRPSVAHDWANCGVTVPIDDLVGSE
ncbi:MAG: DMT family transporter [Acidimicrobiia bacterium]